MESKEKELSPWERLEGFVWTVLRAAYARVLAAQLQTSALEMTDEQINAALDPWHRAMQADLGAIMEAMKQARHMGQEATYARLHETEVHPVASHELLDQALQPSGVEESPEMPHPRHGFL